MKDGRLNYDKPVPMDQMVDASLVHKAAASLLSEGGRAKCNADSVGRNT